MPDNAKPSKLSHAELLSSANLDDAHSVMSSVKVGDSTFFIISDIFARRTLWSKADSEESASILIAGDVSPYNLTDFNGRVLFYDRIGNRFHISDTSGAEFFSFTHPGRGATAGSNDDSFGVLGDYFYFASYDKNFNNSELWRSDGTLQHTSLFKDLNPGWSRSGGPLQSRPREFTSAVNYLYFTGAFKEYRIFGRFWVENRVLWRTDGTLEGTKPLEWHFEGKNPSLETRRYEEGQGVSIIYLPYPDLQLRHSDLMNPFLYLKVYGDIDESDLEYGGLIRKVENEGDTFAVRLAIKQDRALEGDETVLLRFYADPELTIPIGEESSFIIGGGKKAGVVISTSKPEVHEDEKNEISFTLTRTGDINEALIVKYT